MGLKRYKEGDYKGPFEYWTEAAALGDAEAHFELSTWYRNGEVLRRMRKNNCTEQAAIAGHPYARHNLALSEDEDGSVASYNSCYICYLASIADHRLLFCGPTILLLRLRIIIYDQ